jgi:hypothetical protein
VRQRATLVPINKVSKGVHIACPARPSCCGVVHRLCIYYPGACRIIQSAGGALGARRRARATRHSQRGAERLAHLGTRRRRRAWDWSLWLMIGHSSGANSPESALRQSRSTLTPRRGRPRIEAGFFVATIGLRVVCGLGATARLSAPRDHSGPARRAAGHEHLRGRKLLRSWDRDSLRVTRAVSPAPRSP